MNNALKEEKNPFGYVNSIHPNVFSRTNNRMYNIYLCHPSLKEFYLLPSLSWEGKKSEYKCIRLLDIHYYKEHIMPAAVFIFVSEASFYSCNI